MDSNHEQRYQSDNDIAQSINRAKSLWDSGEKNAAIAVLEVLLRQNLDDGDYGQINFLLVGWYLDVEKPQQAKQALKAVLMINPESIYAEQAKKLYVEKSHEDLKPQSIQSSDPNASSTETSESPPFDAAQPIAGIIEEVSEDKLEPVIGVMLPLTGSYAPYGKRVLKALTLGFEVELEQSSSEEFLIGNANGITLIVADSKNDAAHAKKVLQTMISEKKILMLIGDIVASVSEELAAVCNDEHIPLITFSRKADVIVDKPYVLRVGLTAQAQTKRLVDYSIDALSLKNFAILYPDHAYGQEQAQAFAANVKARGAKIVHFEKYAKDTTTFTPLISKIAKRGFNKELYEHCRKSVPNMNEAKANSLCRSKMPPIIDFDAIFIPDNSKELNYIIPALLSGDILVSHNPSVIRSFKQSTKFHNAPIIRLLGSNSWRDSSLGEKLKTQLDGAVFVDGLAVDDRNERMIEFSSRFQETEEAVPSLMDAQAFDIAGMIKNIVMTEKEKTSERTSMLNILKNQRGLEGALGALEIAADGEITTPLHFLTFADGKMVDMPQWNQAHEQKAVTNTNEQ